MKNLFFTLMMAVASIPSFSQYIETEGSFAKTYERIRGWKAVDGDWIYDDGNAVTWTIVYNVQFFSSPSGREMYGAVVLNSNGAPEYFYNYISNVVEGEDDYGEYGQQNVDILSKDNETGKWEFWQPGMLRFYGYTTSLYLGSDPYTYYFSYFGLKE